MVKKRKSKLERLLSFNQHKKRFGAKDAAADVADIDVQALKKQMISGTEVAYTYGADKNISNHIENLRKEFVGQSELAYYHAKLIVFIRREYKTQHHYAAFVQLWQTQADFLCEHLNTRWLISAIDTFIDHSDDALLKAMLLNACVLINTIKLYESEKFLTNTENAPIVPDRKASLQNERLALFDGTSGFAVGTDDTLRNMRWRLDDIAKTHELGGKIVQQIFANVQVKDTVYARFKALHTRSKTAWW